MNKTITNLVLSLSICLYITSCKQNTEETKIASKEERIKTVDSFEYKLKNEPKIFLYFWDGMSKDDFIKAVGLLAEKESIAYDNSKNYIYFSDNCLVNFEPSFNKKGLKSIKLISQIDCIYPLFQEKYKLPNLKNKNLLKSWYTDNNLHYNPIDRYKRLGSSDNFSYIPAVLIDKTPSLQKRVYHNVNSYTRNNTYTDKGFYKDKFVLDKGNVVIIFEQKFADSKLDKRYSLEENQDALAFDTGGMLIYHIGDNKPDLDNSIFKNNSKLVTIFEFSNLEKTITYMSKKEFNRINDSIIVNIKKDNLIKTIKRDSLKRKKEKTLKEI